MEENTLYRKPKQWVKTFDILSWVLEILFFIFLFLPLFAYEGIGKVKADTLNLIDLFTEMSNKMDLLYIVALGGLSTVSTSCTSIFSAISRDKWKEKTKRRLIWFICCFVLYVACIILFLYRKNYTLFTDGSQVVVPLQKALGFYLVVISSFLSLAINGVFTILLCLLSSGKLTEEKLFPNSTPVQAEGATTEGILPQEKAPSTEEATSSQATVSAADPTPSSIELSKIEERLKSLTRLKEVGVITEEEYASKKAELLAKYE